MGGRIDYTDRKTDERMDVQPVVCAERWMDIMAERTGNFQTSSLHA